MMGLPQPSRFDAYCREVQKDNPVGFWPLSEPAGMSSPFARDYRPTTSPNPGTFTGGYTLGQPGPFAGSRSVQFDGSSGLVTIPATRLPSGNAPQSFELWINIASASGVQVPFAYGAGVNGEVFGFYLNPTLVIWQYADDTRTGVSISPNRWHHVAITSSGTTVSAYLDGVLVYSMSASLNVSLATASIGGDAIDSNYYFNGSVALVAVYPSLLSPARIAARIAIATGQRGRRRAYSIGSMGKLFRRSLTNRAGSRGVAA